MSLETLGGMLEALKKNHWSAENVMFGSGGALLQRMNRDTMKCAYKCTSATVDGVEVSVSCLVFITLFSILHSGELGFV